MTNELTLEESVRIAQKVDSWKFLNETDNRDTCWKYLGETSGLTVELIGKIWDSTRNNPHFVTPEALGIFIYASGHDLVKYWNLPDKILRDLYVQVRDTEMKKSREEYAMLLDLAKKIARGEE